MHGAGRPDPESLPTGKQKPNYESKRQAGRQNLEWRLIVINVPQQVDQSPITNPNTKQTDWTQKGHSL